MEPPRRPRPRENAFETHEEELPSLVRLWEALRAIPSLYRALACLVLAALAILIALRSAQGFISRDWAQKDRAAKTRAATPAATDAPAAETRASGEAWHPSPAQRERFWTGILDAGDGSNAFSLLARASREPSAGRTAAGLALATGAADAAETYADLAAFAIARGNLPAALRLSRIACSFRPVPDGAWYNRALALHRVGRNAEAATFLVQVMARHPGDGGARRLLARILLEKQRGDIAFELLAAAAGESTEEEPFALEAACLAAEAGDAEEAVRLFRLAAEKCSLQATTRTWQRPEFAWIRQSEEGESVSAVLASRAREVLRAAGALPDDAPLPRRLRP